MSNRLGGQSLAYRGTKAIQPPNWRFEDRDPNQYDTLNYEIGDLWLNKETRIPWVLVSLAGTTESKGELAEWIRWGGGLETLTGDTGGPVSPDNNANINVKSGITGLTVDGTPLNNTLTIHNTGGGALFQGLEGNSGGHVLPATNGIIDVVGNTTTINVVGNPGTHTLTVSTTGSVATTYTTDDSNFAEASAGNLNVFGVNGIHTTSPVLGGSTLRIGTDGTIATSYHTDTGTAVPSGGVLNIVGDTIDGVTVLTAGAGNTVGIGVSFGSEVPWTPVLKFGGGSTGIVYGVQQGIAYRVGKLGFFSGKFSISSKGSSTGAATISGIPFNRDLAVENTTADFGWERIDATTVLATATWIRARVVEDGSNCLMQLLAQDAAGSSVSAVDNTSFAANTVVTFNGMVFLA
jgi:hypothetical protein